MKILVRYIILFLSVFALILPVEQSAMASESSISSPEVLSNTDEHLASEADHSKDHAGPHILPSKGKQIESWEIAGVPITTTIFSTWIFMAILFSMIALFYVAISTKKFPKCKAFGIDIVRRLLAYASGLTGDESIAKKYMWLLGGLMIVIFLGNIMGLLFDWIILISKDEWLGYYLRPIYSDLSTTLVFGITVILVAQLTAIYLKGPIAHFSHYLFNYHGDSTAEKVVGVFVGWLHFVGEFIRIGSLSMRLFLNILVGAILIGVVVYVGEQIPSLDTGIFRIIVLPFWFFELLVAFLQAYIFMTLSSLYIREALPEKHH